MASKEKKPNKIYFLSDLHIGGEDVLNHFYAKTEFLQFLKKLQQESKKNQVELIIVGDLLDLWEFKERQGLEKFLYLEEGYKKVFQAFKKLSKNAKITLIPGNHDHELACFPTYPKLFKKWGIDLVQKPSLERDFYGKKIWIEHGNRFDFFNKFKKFGDLNETPLGYHINRDLVASVVRISNKNNFKKRENWIKEFPFTHHPSSNVIPWFVSNYFYKELAPILRYLIAPFLVMVTFTVIVFLIALLTSFKIINLKNIFELTNYLGPVKYIANFIIIYDLIMLSLFVIFYGIWKLVKRDIQKRFKYYGLDSFFKDSRMKFENFDQKTDGFFKKNPEIDLLVLGHFHDVAQIKEKASNGKTSHLVSLGTWNKLLVPIRSWFKLPNIYYPYFKLTYAVLEKKEDKIKLKLKLWPKRKIKYSLTWLQRLSILHKKKQPEFKEQELEL
jgi:UDP-2,3-diacylglucosamine pyrophosphatase LpxH